MKFRKEDFKKSTRLRVYMEYAFALIPMKSGPELVGPISVIIDTDPDSGKQYIRVGATKFVKTHAGGYYGRGYFLVFRTAKQLKGKTRFILED
jgi:hypothetical protein